MTAKPGVAIVLPTYQGERFLAPLLESLLGQSRRPDWIFIRDDGSTDQTSAVIKRFQQQTNLIHVLPSRHAKPLGPTVQFSELLQHALKTPASFFFTADQDDRWHPEKIAWSIEAMKEQPPRQPTLVHSDLILVDAEDREIHPSFFRYSGLRGMSGQPLPILLVQNFVTGATVGMNRTLVETMLPIPRDAIMADWWAALIAAATGRIITWPRSTVRYRQHDTNTIGAKSYLQQLRQALMRLVRRSERNPVEFVRTVYQARALQQHVGHRLALDCKSRHVIERYLTAICATGFGAGLTRWRVCQELGVRRLDILRDLALQLRFLCFDTRWLRVDPP